VTFENIAIAAPDGRPVVRGGTLRGELRILPLLTARLDLAEVSLSGSAIQVEVDGDGASPWDGAVANLRERFLTPGRSSQVKRIVVKEADLEIRDRRTQFDTVLRGINVVAKWPTADTALDLTGSLMWRGEPVELTAATIRPGALAAGQSSPIALQVSAPLGRLALNGHVSWPDLPRFVGRTSLETRSLRDLARWSELDLPLAAVIQAFAFEGDVTAEGSDLSWSAARLNVSGDRLEGALSSRREGERRTIAGTLAADRLDLSAFLAPLAQARLPGGGWSSEGIGLDGQSGTDLDLRLSASSARMGPLRMQDLAANISMKPGRYEASIGRVTINKGIVKGRAVLTSLADGIEVKGQSSFERLDLASFLTDMGFSRLIGGMAQGQFALEGAGDTAAEIVRRLNGRASVTVRQGDLGDARLNDALRRVDGKSIALLPGARAARTPFDNIHASVTVTDGVAEVADGGLTGAGLRAGLQGHASLRDGVVALKAIVEGTSSSPTTLDVTGPWDNVTIASEVRRNDGDGAGAGPPVPVQ